MRIENLRIGNYVSTIGGHVGKISLIAPNYVHVTITSEITRGEDEINGIPLTEEWLLKFGFKQQGQRKMWVKDRVCVVLESYTDLSGKPTPESFYIGFKDLGNVLFHTTLKVEHVHELQNAFALTGGELTFKS